MPLGGLLRKRRRVEPGVDDEIKRHWMAVDRSEKKDGSTHAGPSTVGPSAGTPLRPPPPPPAEGTPMLVDAQGVEGDMLSRLLDLNAEHTRLQMLYDDLYARYELAKGQLGDAGAQIEDLSDALEKRDARIKVLRMTIRRLKGKPGAGGAAPLPHPPSQTGLFQQQQQQFPDAAA